MIMNFDTQLKHSFLILALIISLVALPAMAEPDKDMGMKDKTLDKKEMMKDKKYHKKHMMKEDLMKDLNLTANQQERIDAIKATYKAQMETIKNNKMEKKKALMKYMLTKNSNQQEALNQQNEIAKLKDQLDEMHIKKMFQIKEVLTPEQLQKLSDKMEKKMMDHNKKMKDREKSRTSEIMGEEEIIDDERMQYQETEE